MFSQRSRVAAQPAGVHGHGETAQARKRGDVPQRPAAAGAEVVAGNSAPRTAETVSDGWSRVAQWLMTAGPWEIERFEWQDGERWTGRFSYLLWRRQKSGRTAHGGFATAAEAKAQKRRLCGES